MLIALYTLHYKYKTKALLTVIIIIPPRVRENILTPIAQSIIKRKLITTLFAYLKKKKELQ